MSNHGILLFLGAGSNVGASSVALFKENGYKVAAVARTIRDEVKAHSDLVMTADFSDPGCLKGVFEKVEKELGIPNVVVYNPYSWSPGPDFNNPLSAPYENVQKDLNVNTLSAYAAAQEAVKGFDKLPENVKKTFIFTGNKGNTVISPDIFLLAFTKGCTWTIIQNLVATPLFQQKKYRFYYADERTPNGKGMIYISGPAHAEYFLDMAEKDGQGPALGTFVRGKGYVAFKEDEIATLPVSSRAQLAEESYGASGTEEANYGK